MRTPEDSKIVWTDYMKYRAKLRGFELPKVEKHGRNMEKHGDNPHVLVDKPKLGV